MNIGDYVRTEYGIAKYISNKVTKYGMYYVVDKDIMTCNVEGWENCLSGSNEIIKSSPNIIDLIEYGDIVKYKIDNEEFISEVWGEKNNYFVQNFDVPIDLIDLNIVSVITHERFSQMEYKVGD